MAWWLWALIAWSTAASVAVLWLAAEVSDLRSRRFGESSGEPLELPWLPGTSPDPSLLFHFDPASLVVTARARLSRSRVGDRTGSWSALHMRWVTTVATARRAIFGLRGGA